MQGKVLRKANLAAMTRGILESGVYSPICTPLPRQIVQILSVWYTIGIDYNCPPRDSDYTGEGALYRTCADGQVQSLSGAHDKLGFLTHVRRIACKSNSCSLRQVIKEATINGNDLLMQAVVKAQTSP